jgi:hemerythrin superfamily protein
MAAPHSDQDDMITELTKDHEEVKEAFQKLLDSAPSQERQHTLQHVITELVRHSVAEEMHLYPLTRKVLEDGDQLADHEIQEHAEVEQLLKDLEQMDQDDAQFEPRLRQLVQSTLHRAKKMAPTRPHPSSPDTPPGNVVLGPLVGLVDRVRDAASGRHGS